MKKILLVTTALLAFTAAPALAADLAPRMITKAPPAYWDWTGFYLGGYAGVGANRSRGYDPIGAAPGELQYIGSGFTGGLTAGYNLQVARKWVLGIEGDIGYLGFGRTTRDWNELLLYDSRTSWIGTVRGRVGYTDGPNLSYFTGGLAGVQFEDKQYTPGQGIVSSTRTKLGYTYGSGVETMLGGNWTAKSEYAYVNVGAGDARMVPSTVFNVQVDHRYHVQKFGLNYQFSGKAQPVLPAGNWGGLYGGIGGGSAVAQVDGHDPSDAVSGEIDNNGQGLSVGGIAGYNWQFARNWVAGAEGDFSWLGIRNDSLNYNDLSGAPLYSNLGIDTHWLATLRGRLGYSTGPALLYVTGGGAWVNVKDTFQGTLAANPAVSSTKTLSGYTVGGGIETTFLGPWTSRTEYLFVNAGKGDVLTATSPLQADHKFHLFRSALVYKLGG